MAFANALPKDWPGPRGSRAIAGPPLAAKGAGLLDRHEEALMRGDAVSSEFTNRGWVRYLGHTDVPVISPEEAGENLAGIALRHDLTLFAHYATDTAGHKQALAPAVTALERVDRFLAGLLEARTEELQILIVSDHGNVEDIRGGHTTNPALGLVVGQAAGLPIDGADLRHVPDFVGRLLGSR
ncbi:MAG: alkaline phosphatase family protein [Gemmatimonadota bacterium]